MLPAHIPPVMSQRTHGDVDDTAADFFITAYGHIAHSAHEEHRTVRTVIRCVAYGNWPII
jgi:hypothetical protein